MTPAMNRQHDTDTAAVADAMQDFDAGLPSDAAASGDVKAARKALDDLASRIASHLRPAVTQSLLLDARGAWELLGVSRSEFYRLKSGGELPPAVKLPGRSNPIWRREDLLTFVNKLRPAR
jgi:predicted DNA-binding transcriptional regulator AlpA